MLSQELLERLRLLPDRGKLENEVGKPLGWQRVVAMLAATELQMEMA